VIRKEEEKVVKAMKEAKTAEEMVKSWYTQRPGFEIEDMPVGRDPLAFYEKRKPEMVFTYAHNQLTQLTARGILDPKTRYLVILGCYMMENHWEGILPQCCNAKAAGATEEEIMEVAHIACYAVSKDKLVNTCEALSKAFGSPSFKKTTRLK
jgi:alkylhydroperoxidase/carboxymuconolactone decarboxylase family protein YurZ